MKRILAIMLIVLAAGVMQCQGQQCADMFNKGRSYFQKKDYRSAKRCFEQCKKGCPGSYQGWIDSCDAEIRKQEASFQKKRREAVEAERRKEKAAIERKARVERNRYIFLSVNCAMKGALANIEYELKGDLGDRDSALHFTADSMEAYWFVRVFVSGYGDRSNDDVQAGDNGALAYYVEADIEVENAATSEEKQKPPARVLVREGVSSIPEDRALEFVGNKIYHMPAKKKDFYDKIVNEIIKKIK